jgi:FkbM family methyltransferase
MLWAGNFESAERDFVAAFLEPGMRVVNIGANVGLYAVMASAMVGPAGEVHAFEPSTETYARLLRNLDLNGCRNVITKRLALSNATGRVLLRADPKHPSYDGHRFVEQIDAVRDPRSSDEIVECLRLDDYIASLSRVNWGIDLMIIDVEGAELAVLEGAQQALTRNDPTLLLECSRRQREVEHTLRALGFQFWAWNRGKNALEAASFRQIAMKGDVIVRRTGWSTGA